MNLSELDIKGLGKAKYILKQGGTLGDLYTTSDLKFNDNGYVEVDTPVTIRTMDIGGDKSLPYMQLPKEENPFLGICSASLPPAFTPSARPSNCTGTSITIGLASSI